VTLAASIGQDADCTRERPGPLYLLFAAALGMSGPSVFSRTRFVANQLPGYDRAMRYTLATLAGLCIAATALAWNGLGHMVAAEIPWQQLDDPTRQQIVDTLRRHPRFAEDFKKKMPDDVATADKSVQDHWIFQQAATWPDS
jgi:hypothetical protein